MSFDPFGDFETRVYPRNSLGLKDPRQIRLAEHLAFQNHLADALDHVRAQRRLGYRQILDVHRILFGDVYPGAGQDRATLTPLQVVSKGGVALAFPRAVRDVAEHALQRGQDRAHIRSRPGHVLGELAYAHPFLDGNGRTVLVVFDELAPRAGLAVDWASGDKTAWLDALTRQIMAPVRTRSTATWVH